MEATHVPRRRLGRGVGRVSRRRASLPGGGRVRRAASRRGAEIPVTMEVEMAAKIIFHFEVAVGLCVFSLCLYLLPSSLFCSPCA